MGVFSNYFFGHQKTSKKVDSIIFNWFPDNLYALKYNINNFFWYQDYLNLESYKIISRTFWVLAILALGLKSFKMSHFEFSESAILNFFLLHLSEKSSPFILGIIFFCTMDGFSTILQKKLSELLCTRLYEIFCTIEAP